jgi:hypothetical protein
MFAFQNLEIRMVIPFDTIIYYPDDYKDEYIEEPSFKLLREYLNINIDVVSIATDIYINRRNKAPILVYYSDYSHDDFIAFDTEIDPIDQLELIIIGIRCNAENREEVKKLAREFYDKRCKLNLFSEGYREVRKFFKVDFTKFYLGRLYTKKEIVKGREVKLFQCGETLKNDKWWKPILRVIKRQWNSFKVKI